eukprot:3273973-Lingulodinium_polyedra.AAC.1
MPSEATSCHYTTLAPLRRLWLSSGLWFGHRLPPRTCGPWPGRRSWASSSTRSRLSICRAW